MTNYELLLDINKKTKENIDKLYSSGKMEDINRCITFYNDFDTWISFCNGFSKYELIKEAQMECINSIYLCAQGFYKEAISSLRQFLEHTLFSVMLSTHDYKYRLWQFERCDMSWTQLMDAQNGVFGVQFIQAYAKDVDETKSMELLTISKDVYRECSEFVHGNFEKLNILSDTLMFSDQSLNKYINYFESIKYLICMALFIRFREILNNPDILKSLESVIMDNIGTLPEVQLLYSKGETEDE